MKKIIALLLAIVLISGLFACGSKASENVNNVNIENVENTANTDNTENTENTENNTNNEENTNSNENEEELTGLRNPLTGEEIEEDLSENRPMAIATNNEKAAMPQHGISKADIIIEMNVEHNMTRMLSIFQNITSDIKKIGAIRSARPYFIDWALAFDAVYISASGSVTALAKIRERGVVYVNCNDSAASRLNPYPNIFYRDMERLYAGYPLEHSMFALGEGFEKHKSDMPVKLEHKDSYECPLTFTKTAQTVDGTDAKVFTVSMNPVKITEFEYDSDSTLYKISQHGGPYIDGNTTEQVAVKNVIVLYTKYWPEYAGAITLLADMSGGKGIYFCEGRMIDINWAITDESGLKLTKTDGSDLKLAIGHTFICCPDSETGGVEVK